MNLPWSLRWRGEPSPLTALLAVGDVLAITIFVVAGEISHGYSLVADTGRVAGTLIPFLVGWVLAPAVVDPYAPDAISDLRRVVSRTVPAWAVAVVVAQLLRATSVFHGDLAVTFALVSFAVGGVSLVTWRAGVSLLT